MQETVDIGTTICLAIQKHKQFHRGVSPKRLMLGRKEYGEFQLLNLDHEALGINVTKEDCDSMLVAI
jgi:hypothetical protein